MVPGVRVRAPQLSAPEIKVTYAPMGRDTLAAIADELNPKHGADGRTPAGSTPEIVIGTTPIGRDTLNAIEDELDAAQPTLIRARRGRSSRPPKTAPAAQAQPLEIFEMLTFIVKNVEPSAFSSADRRRSFVERHLGHCLHGHSLEAIARVEMSPWPEAGAVVTRVWCRL